MVKKVICTKCTKVACESKHSDQVPSNCPAITKQDVIQRALAEYDKPEVKEFARQATILASESRLNLPGVNIARYPRVEEVVQFAKKMGYRKLGVAFCNGLRNEAKVLTTILENRGFDVTSVCCQAGGISEEKIGIADEQTSQGTGTGRAMCNPIVQAEILNSEGTEFNIAVGLCVGHDSLFFKYIHALTTVLVVKDRVFGHNPVAGLYLTHSYYRTLLRKEPVES